MSFSIDENCISCGKCEKQCLDDAIYIGDDQLQSLVDIKSKDELIGEIIGLLQSPAKNVLSALTTGKSKIAGIVKTLSEKEQ